MKLKFFPPRLRRLGLMEITANHPGFAGEVMVEDNSFLVGFDRDSGALTRLEKILRTGQLNGGRPVSILSRLAALSKPPILYKRD